MLRRRRGVFGGEFNSIVQVYMVGLIKKYVYVIIYMGWWRNCFRLVSFLSSLLLHAISFIIILKRKYILFFKRKYVKVGLLAGRHVIEPFENRYTGYLLNIRL